jgi:hypothetical protein
MRNLRINSNRLISFAAIVEIPNMSCHEETASSIVSTVAVAAGLVIPLAIALRGA